MKSAVLRIEIATSPEIYQSSHLNKVQRKHLKTVSKQTRYCTAPNATDLKTVVIKMFLYWKKREKSIKRRVNRVF